MAGKLAAARGKWPNRPNNEEGLATSPSSSQHKLNKNERTNLLGNSLTSVGYPIRHYLSTTLLKFFPATDLVDKSFIQCDGRACSPDHVIVISWQLSNLSKLRVYFVNESLVFRAQEIRQPV